MGVDTGTEVEVYVVRDLGVGSGTTDGDGAVDGAGAEDGTGCGLDSDAGGDGRAVASAAYFVPVVEAPWMSWPGSPDRMPCHAKAQGTSGRFRASWFRT